MVDKRKPFEPRRQNFSQEETEFLGRLAERLRRYRDRLKLTQKEAADKTAGGVSASYIKMIENENTTENPSILTLRRLCWAYDIKVGDLFDPWRNVNMLPEPFSEFEESLIDKARVLIKSVQFREPIHQNIVSMYERLERISRKAEK